MTSYIVGIIDYNTGNMKSISKLFKSLGCNVFVSNKIEELKKSDLIILPGVGAFPTAMKNLIKNDLVQFLRNWSNKNKFLLGICLGMQLLCESSEENEDCKGLNIISGKILKLDDIPFNIGLNLKRTIILEVIKMIIFISIMNTYIMEEKKILLVLQMYLKKLFRLFQLIILLVFNFIQKKVKIQERKFSKMFCK